MDEDRRHGGPGRRDYDQVTLQYYLEHLVREIDRRLEKLDAGYEKLDAKQDGFISIGYYDEHHDQLAERLTRVEQWQANIQGRGVALGLLGALFVAIAAGFVGHVLPQ